mgnify:CR=1 FL=1
MQSHEGIAIADLAAAIHRSLATRIYSMASRIKIKPAIALTGGGAKNIGLISALEEKAGYKLVIPDEPLMTGAIGAVVDTLFSIPLQLAVRRSGGTDAKAIHVHGRGVPTAVIGVPARYIHTHVSLIHLDDYEAAVRLVIAVLRRLDRQAAAGLVAFE